MNRQLTTPGFCIDIFLNPGEFYFGDKDTRIRTILGSCVAITLWHSYLKIGGMCHYMLPVRDSRNGNTELDGRYADDAMTLFMRELNKTASQPINYEVKMFGGGDQFPEFANGELINLPAINIQIGRNLLKQHGFSIKAEHIGGTGHRNVIFDFWSGEVWIQHVAKR